MHAPAVNAKRLAAAGGLPSRAISKKRLGGSVASGLTQAVQALSDDLVLEAINYVAKASASEVANF